MAWAMRKIARFYMILNDYADTGGAARGIHFRQDLLVAMLIKERESSRHDDVTSEIDESVAHVASFNDIAVIDVRPPEECDDESIVFRQAALVFPQSLGETDSLSCLHAIKHFGLGRYTDPLNVDGQKQ